jgi:hypothetical protein
MIRCLYLNRLESSRFQAQPVTSCDRSFGVVYTKLGAYSIDSFKMIGGFPEVLN